MALVLKRDLYGERHQPRDLLYPSSEHPCDLQILNKDTIVYDAQLNGAGFETWLIFFGNSA